MSGKFALIGGDEFRKGCEDMDKMILQETGQNPAQVVIVPTAAVTNPIKAADHGARYFTQLGSTTSKLMVLDKKSANDKEFLKGLEGANVIYFTGGDPNHLLEILRASLLLRLLLKAVGDGAILAGSSAGAMVMGSFMYQSRSHSWVTALDIVPGLIFLPHHERIDPETLLAELPNRIPADSTLLGIDARTGCLGTDGNWSVIGHGNVTVYQNAKWKSYHAGEALPTRR